MLPIWPSNLPQEWYDPDTPPTQQGQDNTIRSQTSAGPAKLRRRFTAIPEDVVVVNTLTTADLDFLKDFVKNTLFEVGQFTWIDHSAGTEAGKYVNYRFKSGWNGVQKTHFAGDLWTVTLTLELMP